jgi:raffinose/stachyose/melibiose transport system permease protein
MALRKYGTNILIYAFLILAFVVFTFPFFLLIVNSFKDNGEIMRDPFSLPQSYDLDQFFGVIKAMDFATTFTNTFFITFMSVLLILIFSGMTAHYLVRNSSLFNNTFFAIMVASMIIPFQALMIPLIYIYGAKLGLIDTAPISLLIGLYVGFGASFATFVYHGFIKSIPLELEEAALIDGCNRIQTYFRIVFPMLTPTSVTIAILNVLWIWNDYLLPSLIIYNEDDLTMPIKMKVFNGTYMDNWELLIPAMLMTILPILVAYLIGQKFIIKGVMQGAIK